MMRFLLRMSFGPLLAFLAAPSALLAQSGRSHSTGDIEPICRQLPDLPSTQVRGPNAIDDL